MVKTQALPIGIQSFEDIRKNNYLYVDKTEEIYNLISSGKVYFLSRPRRFGKSLLISTFHVFFSGKKELFKGLKVEKLEKEWKKYPVFHFDLGGKEYRTRADLENKLLNILDNIKEEYKLTSTQTSPELIFSDLLKSASEKYGNNVVVLVDEYDKPLLENFEDKTVAEEYRSLIRGFFGVLKSCDNYLKFVFITGVTKFSKVSIFSDLNQLNDISLSASAETICGITQKELESNFKSQISELAKENSISDKECLSQLKAKYDGYHFSNNLVDVYNPYSLLKTFSDKFFGTYWFETGTPTFLIKQLEETNFDFYNFTEGVEYSIPTLMNKSDADFDVIQLLYQAGYITIKEWNKEFNTFLLRYPNEEVEYSFLAVLLPSFLNKPQSTSDLWIREFYKDIKEGNIDSFMTRLKSIIASVPYATDKRTSEHDFQITVYLIFTLLGQFTSAESYTNKGRIDCVVETSEIIYIFEFKVDQPFENAITQIKDKNYFEKYLSSKKQIKSIGITFNSKKRNIDSWIFFDNK